MAFAGVLALTAAGCSETDPVVFVDAVVDEHTGVGDDAGGDVSVARETSSSGSSAATTLPVTPIVVDRAWSPANATAEIIGTGALVDDIVTVDGELAVIDSFTIDADGRFSLRVTIDDEGAHTVCVRDSCSRVFTLAADAESIGEVEAKIAQARSIAATMFDAQAEFPDWSVEVSGPFASIGGTTDPVTKTITVFANRGRSVEDFVVTLLHEWAHVLDAERLDDDERAAYTSFRGYGPATPWRSEGDHSIEAWSGQPSEDFAEVMVALWTASTEQPHQVRTVAPGGPPDDIVFETVIGFLAP